MPVRVLIAGYGYVGHQLAQVLKADHHKVIGIKRTQEPHACDRMIIRDILNLQDHDLPEVDFVVYCPSSNHQDETAYQRIYAQGAKNLCNIYEKRSVKPRILYTSSTRVYEQNHGQWVDEDSPCAATDPLAQCILNGEEHISSSTLDSMIIRFSGIYGPHRHYLLNALRQKNARLCHSLRFSNRIHVIDCARVLYHLMRVHYNEGLYIASDNEPTPINTIIAWLSATTGIPLPDAKHDDSSEPGDHQSNKQLNNARLVHTGFRFEFANYRQGFKHILQENGTLPPEIK